MALNFLQSPVSLAVRPLLDERAPIDLDRSDSSRHKGLWALPPHYSEPECKRLPLCKPPGCRRSGTRSYRYRYIPNWAHTVRSLAATADLRAQIGYRVRGTQSLLSR